MSASVPTDLPVEASIPGIRSALAESGHAVLVAPTGSGKTTIVPLRLVDEPWLDGARIVVLEPRRIATRAAARRMASLLGESVGETVGYSTRDDRKVGPATRIEVITEGVLTRRLQRDPDLPGTGLVVFDEIHERSLQTDLGLALALDARRLVRPDIRILAMSATVDADRVAAVLGGDSPAPIIESEARQHPVEIHWSAPPRRARIEDHTAMAVRRALGRHDGSLLVFLPGMGEIRRAERALGEPGPDVAVHILHGSLPADAQDAAIAPAPSGTRKVVLSTDIAESSLTVDGVSVVIDSGIARKPRMDVRTGMTRLHTTPISRASADQRSGRAGRLGPGTAYRLWSKMEHGTRARQTMPEIQQVDLAGLLLELAAWGTRDPDDLQFLDPPPARAVHEAARLLRSLGAIDGDGRITTRGADMARLPAHPRLARMVVDAGADGRLACVLAALIDGRDILRGHPDEIPVDLALRVEVIEGRRHPQADGRAVAGVRREAGDLAERAGVTGTVNPDASGRVVALAFPDRLAVRRGSPGRFQLRTGTTAWIPAGDPLAVDGFVVAADLDGRRKDARIRLAAALDPDDVAAVFGDEVTDSTSLTWSGSRLIERRERMIGGLTLDRVERRPEGSPAVTAAILDRIRDRDLADLSWTTGARSLQRRVSFLNRTVGEPWPDWSDAALAAELETWLLPFVTAPTGIDDVRRVDLTRALRRSLPHRAVADLDRLAPTHIDVPSGRSAPVDYTGDQPFIAVKVQEMFGTTATPQAGGRPVVLHLLSPADRPVQITADLAGFWTGSWHQVRKEMAGRYPKHAWPEDPAHARPVRR